MLPSAPLWPLLFAAVASAVASHGMAQQVAPASSGRDGPRAAGGVSLTLRTATGDARFRQGETITLALTFVNRGPETYSVEVDTNTWPLGLDAIVIEPPAVRVDWTGGWGVVGSVLGNAPVPLTGDGVIVAFDLNEAWRVERPGRYRVFVRSTRVAPEPLRRPGDRLSVASNAIELEILPPGPPLDPGALAAAPSRALRFLDTEQAAGELARRLLHGEDDANLRGADANECARGLLGSSHHAFIVPVMEQWLGASDRRVSGGFVDTLARLAAMLEHPAREDDTGDTAVQRQAAYARALSRYAAVALDGARRGSPEDRALALADLLEAATANGVSGHGGPRADAPAAAELVNVFEQLPTERQWMLLNARWRWLAHQTLVPVLERILDTAATADSRLATIALVRLSELSPDRAATRARRDIESGRGLFAVEALASAIEPAALSSTTLDRLLVEQLRAQTRTPGAGPAPPHALAYQASTRIARYATESIAPEVLQIYETQTLSSCGDQAAILAYLLRVLPDTATRLVDAALSRPSMPGCASDLLRELAGFRADPILESVALPHLSDRDPLVAASAAHALRIVGTDRGRDALWRALERWHGEWKDRPDALVHSALGPTPADAQLMLGRALREALTQAVNWRPTESDIERLAALCHDESCRLELRAFCDHGAASPHTITALLDEGRWLFLVDEIWLPSVEAVHTRMTLYPPGTVFRWGAGDSISDEGEAALLLELRAAAGARSQQVVPAVR